jgi:hypothetical protein
MPTTCGIVYLHHRLRLVGKAIVSIDFSCRAGRFVRKRDRKFPVFRFAARLSPAGRNAMLRMYFSSDCQARFCRTKKNCNVLPNPNFGEYAPGGEWGVKIVVEKRPIRQ